MDELLHFLGDRLGSLPVFQGASYSEIFEVEKLAAKPLPRVYSEFLHTMGVQSNGLDPFWLTKSQPKAVIDWHLRYPRTRRSLDTRLDLFTIGHRFAAGTAVLEIFLELGDAEDGKLHYGFDGIVCGVLADSLRCRLFRVCFSYSNFLSRRCVFLRPEDRTDSLRQWTIDLNRVREAAEKIGFTILPWSDSVSLCAEQGEIALEAEQLGDDFDGWVILFSPHLTAIEPLISYFQSSCDLDVVPYHRNHAPMPPGPGLA